ncbi:MAG: MBL fold metallo-hydrolase [Acidobacteria bacterium]|nr:MBL fold metallo-hydrolase [Acidobacteriota bacterium]
MTTITMHFGSSGRRGLLAACFLAGITLGGLVFAGEGSGRAPSVRLHYLGHASFVFAFDNGVTLLVDYGVSNAYGLTSPIHDLGDLKPDLVAYTHHDPDHDRQQAFPGATVIDGKDFALRGIRLQAIPVSERARDDNTGYLIRYKGLTLFLSGDLQGDLTAPDAPARWTALKKRLPSRLDLLLVPVGWVRPVPGEAAGLVEVLRPRAVIPTHYWSAAEKADFLDRFRSRPGYVVEDTGSPSWGVDSSGPPGVTRVVSLTPAPWTN